MDNIGTIQYVTPQKKYMKSFILLTITLVAIIGTTHAQQQLSTQKERSGKPSKELIFSNYHPQVLTTRSNVGMAIQRQGNAQLASDIGGDAAENEVRKQREKMMEWVKDSVSRVPRSVPGTETKTSTPKKN